MTFVVDSPEGFVPNVSGPWEPWAWPEEVDRWIEDVKRADIAVVDSYRPTQATLEQAFLACEAGWLYFDDVNRVSYPGGTVVNGVPEGVIDYSAQPNGPRFLIGTQWQCLRPAFQGHGSRMVRHDIDTVLLTLGGDDTRLLGPSLYSALVDEASWTVTVVTTDISRSKSQLQALVRPPHRLVCGAKEQEMAQLMKESDVAISAAGQTLYEMAALGLPTIPVLVADNQAGLARAWVRANVSTEAMRWDQPDLAGKVVAQLSRLRAPDLRQTIARTAQGFVDGRGAERLAAWLRGQR